MIQAAFNTQEDHETCRIPQYPHMADGPTRQHDGVQSAELRAWICTEKKRTCKNDARNNGTCRMRPGRQAGTRKITVSKEGDGALMAMVHVMLVRVWKSRVQSTMRTLSLPLRAKAHHRPVQAGIEPAPPGSCTRLPPANAEGSTSCLRG